MGDNGGEPERKGEPAGKRSDDPPDDVEVSRDMLREAKTQPGRVQPGPGARQATLEIAREDPGADPEPPANAEKAAMATAPGDKHELCEILPAVGMSKSSHGCAGGVPIVLSRAQTDFFGSCRREFSTLVSGEGSSWGTRSRMMAHMTPSLFRATALGARLCLMPLETHSS